jgi:hypothetical protein
MNRNGVIVWEGASQLDGAPIVVVMTGLATGSGNRKTGDMLQTWILRADADPIAAVKEGLDESICGDCPHRLRFHYHQDGTTGKKRRTCYVNLGQAPLAVYRAFRRGRYRRLGDPKVKMPAPGTRALRIGSYGDPAAVPVGVWENLVRRIAPTRRTGYTHQWRNADPRFRELCMASADSPADVPVANAAGWRTFLVLPHGIAASPATVQCPSDPARTGPTVGCADCGMCAGSGGKYRRNVYIRPHGTAARFVTLPTAA